MVDLKRQGSRCSPNLGVTSIPSVKSGEVWIDIATKNGWDELILRDSKNNRHPEALLLGWLEALFCIIAWRKLRQPLSLAQFLAWKQLPLPTQND
jgi:hypothetical protein